MPRSKREDATVVKVAMNEKHSRGPKQARTRKARGRELDARLHGRGRPPALRAAGSCPLALAKKFAHELIVRVHLDGFALSTNNLKESLVEAQKPMAIIENNAWRLHGDLELFHPIENRSSTRTFGS
jgi:hypothetical protein